MSHTKTTIPATTQNQISACNQNLKTEALPELKAPKERNDIRGLPAYPCGSAHEYYASLHDDRDDYFGL